MPTVERPGPLLVVNCTSGSSESSLILRGEPPIAARTEDQTQQQQRLSWRSSRSIEAWSRLRPLKLTDAADADGDEEGA